MKLKLNDAGVAAVFGLPTSDTDTEAILKEYASRNWKDAETMAHIDAAVNAGAYIKTYPTRSEKVVKAGDAGEGK